VRESFDYILINTPPLSQNADGALLGKHADGVILVAQAERTERGRLAVTKEQLEKAQCRVLGVVLTHNKEYIPAFLRRHGGSSRQP
jgi:Mrp family chromosome partitioning ATPase